MSESLTFKKREKVFDDRRVTPKSTATMAGDASPAQIDKSRPREGWEKLLIDVDGHDKWRWVHPDEDTVQKHSSIHTHYVVGEVSEEGDESSSSGTSSADDAPPGTKRQKMLLALPSTRTVSPSSKSSAKKSAPSTRPRVNDGIYKLCQACERKKKFKVVECPCEHSQRTALAKLLLRSEDDPAYQKYFDTVSNAVKVFDDAAKTGVKTDHEIGDAEQVSVRLRCPKCECDLYLCTQSPFPKEEDPYQH